MVDLKTLPPPAILEEPEAQVLFQEFMDRFKELSPNYGYFTASSPIVHLAQALAYRELVWRNRGNEIVMSRILAFATGGDLDHLGSFCSNGGVERMVLVEANADVVPAIAEVKEDDEAFRRRIQLKLASPATAGSREHYLFHALSASPAVKDALAYSPDFPGGFNLGGRVNITILSREGNGIPSSGLLQQVEQVVCADDVAVLTDLVTIEPARLKPINIRAVVVLFPDTPVAQFNGLKPYFEAEFAKVQRLGYVITPSWLNMNLHRPGVQNVTLETPNEPVPTEPYEYPSLQNVEIVFGGFYTGMQFDEGALELNRLYNDVYSFYRNFAIRNKRSILNILADLNYIPRAGVVQPTLTGFASFLGIKNVTGASGVARPADEIAAAIWFVLSQEYEKVLV